MALKLFLDSLDGVDEGVKALYTEHDGKFKLAVDGLEDTSGLKSALEKERKARRDAEARAKSALGDDELEEFERLRAEAAKARGAEDLVNQVKARHAKELEAKEKLALQYKSTLEKTVLESTATQLLAKHGGNVGLLMPHIMGALRVEESDGQFRVVPANAVSVDEVVAGLKASYPAAFADSGKSGGGASGGGAGGGGKTMKTAEFNSLRPKEQAEFMAAKGTLQD